MITKFKLFENTNHTDHVLGAILLNEINTVKHFLNEENGDINIVFNTGENMLAVASRNGWIEIMNYLIDEGINLDWSDWMGRSVLNLLCSNNIFSESEKIVKILIDAGSDLNITDKRGDTALIKAALVNEMDLVNLLIDTNWNIIDNVRKSFYDFLYKTNQDFIRNTYPEKYKEYIKGETIKKFKI